jgi:hypothetical protein
MMSGIIILSFYFCAIALAGGAEAKNSSIHVKSGGREAKTHRDKIFPTPEGGQILTLGVPFHPFWKNINSYAVRYRDDSGSVNP